MRTRTIAAMELALIFPAALFMTALVVRNLSPLGYEPAHSAQQVVMWYAGRMWTLWVLLLALPFTVLITGCATLRYNWNRELPHTGRPLLAVIRADFATGFATNFATHWATLLVAATTLAAGGILAIVVLHMLAN